MHRVELKGAEPGDELYTDTEVPNAPCGVESNDSPVWAFTISAFLMHRVELKVSFFTLSPLRRKVPNAPCGVESVELKN